MELQRRIVTLLLGFAIQRVGIHINRLFDSPMIHPFACFGPYAGCAREHAAMNLSKQRFSTDTAALTPVCNCVEPLCD